MWLEIIITLLLGGLTYVLVCQLNSKPTKSFKVTDRKRSRTVLMKYTSFDSFSEKCRAKFNLSKNEKLHFASGEDGNIELDEECLVDMEDKTLLIVKGETSGSNDDDDVENDDWFGFESHGSDSFTGDTVVDNDDMKKSEDKQAGRTKFDLGKNEKLHFAPCEDGNLELDEECLVDLEDKSFLTAKGEKSGHNDDDDDDVDDEHDKWFEFESHGSDSVTDDTIADNNDMNKWEDIQADGNLELEEKSLVDLEDKSLLIAEGETSGHNNNDDDDDEHDEWFEFESHGSNSFTGDTIADNDDMKKWEDIQADFGRAKFGLSKNEKLSFACGEDGNLELYEECLVDDFEDKSLLFDKGDTSRSSDADDVDDENDDRLGLGIFGSDSSTGDIVVDNADIKKWEDIQAGSEVKDHIIKYGLINIGSVLKENVTAWRRKPLNIAVTGESGKGKSSFINAFLGMSPEQDGFAEIDEEECTRDCRAFRHPKYDSFILWDVPGVGTRNFPKEKYLNAIQVNRFDFFMIISSNRFSELDSWLAKEILRMKKRFYFIRTKIDIDMSEKKKRFQKRGQQFCENEELGKMKTEIFEKLYYDVGVEKLQFFMISNHHPNKYDFPLILNQLLKDVQAKKKDAMLFGLAGVSQNVLAEKFSALKSRIWKVALLSGVGAAIPIPFLSASIDTKLILSEVLFYREQFGLDDQSLKYLADLAGISLEHLKSAITFKTPEHLFTSAGFAKHLIKNTAVEVSEIAVRYTIPVIGSAFICGTSYYITMRILESILEIMQQDALNVLEYVTSRKTETEIE